MPLAVSFDKVDRQHLSSSSLENIEHTDVFPGRTKLAIAVGARDGSGKEHIQHHWGSHGSLQLRSACLTSWSNVDCKIRR